jgi:ATP-binding cassette subfamily B protein
MGQPISATEFTVADSAATAASSTGSSLGFDTRSPGRWLWSHLRRYPLLLGAAVLFTVTAWSLFGLTPVMTGRVAEAILDGATAAAILAASLTLLAAYLGDAFSSLISNICAVTLAHRLERDARDELYRSLLGKSQTYHNRQRVGDLVARATDDTRTLNNMIHPGILFMSDMVMGFLVPMIYIALIDVRLLLVPSLYAVAFVFAVRAYVRRLGPVMNEQRSQHGHVNARLEEAISGIEVVKAAAREVWERQRFRASVVLFRDLFVRQGRIEGIYMPMLIFAAAFAAGILQGILLMRAGAIDLGQLIAVIGLVHLLRIPTFMSSFSFSLVQNGLAGARRLLTVLTATTEVDQNARGNRAAVRGALAFEAVSFAYDTGRDVLREIDVRIEAGETVAIVGQTGSGKSTLTQLVNRTYDPTAGRVLVDDIDLREWSLDSLRPQIASIEQDIFLFSRTIAENIAFARQDASRGDVEAAARAAAADDFIRSFKDGYDTTIGERGITLSGGQRQRLALARAFLKDPRILILDDSTSAIDSETEDEIQRALSTVQRGRTTLIITHRLSQIRWADRILVLAAGRLAAMGSHDQLLAESQDYRRIFSRYDIELPPMSTMQRAPAGDG